MDLKVILLSFVIISVVNCQVAERNMTYIVGYGRRHEDDTLLATLIQTSEEFTEVTDTALRFDFDSGGGYLTFVNISRPTDMEFRYRSITLGWRPTDAIRNSFESTAILYNSTKYELHAKIYGFRYPIGPVYP